MNSAPLPSFAAFAPQNCCPATGLLFASQSHEGLGGPPETRDEQFHHIAELRETFTGRSDSSSTWTPRRGNSSPTSKTPVRTGATSPRRSMTIERRQSRLWIRNLSAVESDGTVARCSLYSVRGR